MTAYLQPGDKIHIAVGINTTHSVVDANQQVRDQLKTFEEAYGAIGVGILTITGTAGLLAPVIVAVIRIGGQGTDSLAPGSPRRYRSAEKLKLVDEDPLPWQAPPEATEPPRVRSHDLIQTTPLP